MAGKRRVALAVDTATAELTADDLVLADALWRRGIEVRPMVWGSEQATRSDVVVIRSTWDYVERVDEFRSWFDDLDTARVEVGPGGSAPHVARLLESDDVLVQPFVTEIETDGEVSVIAIGGVVTHAVEKRSAAGEWRVQSDFGGSVTRVDVTHAHRRAVASVLSAVDGTPGYARVDLVAIGGVLHLMELELIEPDLFFRLAPEAAERLAGRLVGG